MALVDVIAARRELDRVKASSGGPRVVLDHDGVVSVGLLPAEFADKTNAVNVRDSDGRALVAVDGRGSVTVEGEAWVKPVGVNRSIHVAKTGEVTMGAYGSSGLYSVVVKPDGHVRTEGGYSRSLMTDVSPDGGVVVQHAHRQVVLTPDNRMLVMSAGGTGRMKDATITVHEADGDAYVVGALAVPRLEGKPWRRVVRLAKDEPELQPGDLVEAMPQSGWLGNMHVVQVGEPLPIGPQAHYRRWACVDDVDVDADDPRVLRLGRRRREQAVPEPPALPDDFDFDDLVPPELPDEAQAYMDDDGFVVTADGSALIDPSDLPDDVPDDVLDEIPEEAS